MAVINPLVDLGQTGGASMGDKSLLRIMWPGLTSATSDVGYPVAYPEWADRTIHGFATNYLTGVASTVGTTPTAVIQGSNDFDPNTDPTNATWITLTDQNGVAMSYSAAFLKQCTESPLWIRPAVTAGTGSIVTFILIARRIQPMITGG